MEPHDLDSQLADLVPQLLAARTDPATERFDRELDEAVAAGSLDRDVAHHLQFWQRASLQALGDHARTVLPVALGALEASRRAAESHLEQLVMTIDTPATTETSMDAEPAADADADADEHEDAGAAPDDTVITLPEPIRLEASQPKLLVAGLVTTAQDIHAENHRA